MKVSISGLRKCLRTFDANGKFAKIGVWSITRGGYDLQWQLMLNNTPIIDCVDNTIVNNTDQNLDKIIEVIKQEYPDVNVKNNVVIKESQLRKIIRESLQTLMNEQMGSVDDVWIFMQNNRDCYKLIYWLQQALEKKVRRGLIPEKSYLMYCSTMGKIIQLGFRLYSKSVSIIPTKDDKLWLRNKVADYILSNIRHNMENTTNLNEWNNDEREDYWDDEVKCYSKIKIYYNPQTLEICDENKDAAYIVISSTDFPDAYSKLYKGDNYITPDYTDEECGGCGGDFEIEDGYVPEAYASNKNSIEKAFIEKYDGYIIDELTNNAKIIHN